MSALLYADAKLLGAQDNEVLVKIMLTLMDYFSPVDRRRIWTEEG
jgi:hypothetical protein